MSETNTISERYGYLAEREADNSLTSEEREELNAYRDLLSLEMRLKICHIQEMKREALTCCGYRGRQPFRLRNC